MSDKIKQASEDSRLKEHEEKARTWHEETRAAIEPLAADLDRIGSSPTAILMISCAVSLKRIADAMEKK